ncbi:MAG: HDOD domain-containing protein [Gallionellaceae bacterium]
MNLDDKIESLKQAVHNLDILPATPVIEQAVQSLDILPATPVIANKLLSMKMGTKESQQHVLLLAEQDPQISAKVIGLANSQKVPSGSDIHSVREASIFLGLPKFQSVVFGIATMSLLTRKSMGHYNMHDSWLHSLGIAFAMTGIARFMPESIRPPDDNIFLAGMLHDIGYLVLASLDPMRSDMLSEFLAADPQVPALEIERKWLGITHDELGAELARHWNLPNEIITVLRYHHAPDAAEGQTGQPLARMVNIAEKLLPSFGINEYVAPGISAEEWEVLGINPDQADEVRKHVAEQAEQATQFANTYG